MASVTRNVTDINPVDRQALEHVIGQRLSTNHQVIINAVDIPPIPATDERTLGTHSRPLPPWCNVYEGLTDEQIAEVEASIVRSPGGRMTA